AGGAMFDAAHALVDVLGGDPRRGHRSAEAVQRDDAQGEEQLLAEVWRPERRRERGKHGSSCDTQDRRTALGISGRSWRPGLGSFSGSRHSWWLARLVLAWPGSGTNGRP